MIVKAKYVGPFFEVGIPGFENKKCRRGETAKIRLAPGVPIGGCWEIVEGAAEYKKGFEPVAKTPTAKTKTTGKKAVGK